MTVRWLLALLLLSLGSRASAQIDVDAELDGSRIDARVGYWCDESGKATIEQVRTLRGRFQTGRSNLHFGVGRPGACWLRIPVRNRADTPRTWMLQVGYPHLDYVTLYLPVGDALQQQQTGDMLPFSKRSYQHHHLVFQIEEPARSERALYVRVDTRGLLYTPLRAWEERRYVEDHYLQWTVLFGFYGIVAIMASYNLLLFALTRLREYGLFALVVLSEGFTQVAAQGHAQEFLMPENVDLAQRMAPFSMNFAIFANCLFASHRVFDPLPRWLHRTAQAMVPVTALCALLTLFVPFSTSLLLVGFCYLLLMPMAGVVAASWRLSMLGSD